MRVLPWSLGLAVIVGAATVSAQPANSPLTTILLHGVQLRQQGRDEAALAEFRRADQLSHEPRITAQIGLAEQALQRWVDASRHLREALSSSQDGYIVRHRADLEPALAEVERHLGTVVVTGGVQGAEVWVGGVFQGTLPLAEPLHLAEGSVVVEVRAPGYTSFASTVDVRVGNAVRVTAVLPRLVATTAAAQGGSALRPSAVTAAPSWSAGRRAGLGLLLSGVALAGVGALGIVLSQQEVNSFNGLGCVVDPGTSRTYGLDTCVTHYNNGQAWLYTAYGGFALGGVSALVGVILLATSGSAPTRAAGREFRCFAGMGGVTAMCEGSF